MSAESAAAAAKLADGTPGQAAALDPDGGDGRCGRTIEEVVRLYRVEDLQLKAHPVADAFPLLSDSEIVTLAGDIKKHGQHERVVLQFTEEGVEVVLDGRNRLLACERAGIPPQILSWK